MNNYRVLLTAMLVLAILPGVSFSGESRIAPPLDVLKKTYDSIPGGSGGAVVLSRIRKFDTGNGNNELVAFQAVLLLDDDAAEDYGQISVSFNSYYEDISLDFAQLVEEDGQTHPISVDAVQIQSRGSGSAYDDIRYLVFALPRVSKNTVIEYQYRIRSKKQVIEGYWYERLHFQGGQRSASGASWRMDPVLRSEIDVRIPVDGILRSRVINRISNPVITTGGGYKHYKWIMENLPEISIESGMQAVTDRVPFLEISDIPDWSVIDSWASRWYLPDWNSQSKLNSILVGSVEKTPPLETIIRSVFDFTQSNIRYIEADVMRGGFIPHSPSEVLDRRYGDCKDQSVFIASVLRSRGVKAFPALVSVFPDAGVFDSVPSLHFSHSIVYIDDGSGTPFFLDTSGETGVYPGIDWSLEGMRVFIVDGKGGRLLTVPESSAVDNLIRVNLAYRFEDGDIDVDFDIRVDGSVGNRFGAWVKKDADKKLKQVATSMFSGSKLVNVSVGEIVPGTPFHVLGQVKYENSWSVSKKKIALGGSILGSISTFTDTLPMVPPEKRLGDYYVYHPYTIRYKATVSIPAKGFRPIVTNSGIDVNADLYSIHHYQGDENDPTDFEMEFTMRRGHVALSKYRLFYSGLDQALAQARWDIVFLRDKNRVREGELVRDAGNSEGPAARIRLARHYLDVGEYEKALSESRATVEKFPDYGEAYYILGISYGFMDREEMSRDALDKAKSLGYRF